jgi:hypothetical protein
MPEESKRWIADSQPGPTYPFVNEFVNETRRDGRDGRSSGCSGFGMTSPRICCGTVDFIASTFSLSPVPQVAHANLAARRGIASAHAICPSKPSVLAMSRVAIPQVRVSRGVAVSPRQESPQPQEPDVTYHQTLISRRGR